MQILKSFLLNLDSLKITMLVTIGMFLYVMSKSNINYKRLVKDFKSVITLFVKIGVTAFGIVGTLDLFFQPTIFGIQTNTIVYVIMIGLLVYTLVILSKITNRYMRAYKKWIYLAPFISWISTNIIFLLNTYLTK